MGGTLDAIRFLFRLKVVKSVEAITEVRSIRKDGPLVLVASIQHMANGTESRAVLDRMTPLPGQGLEQIAIDGLGTVFIGELSGMACAHILVPMGVLSAVRLTAAIVRLEPTLVVEVGVAWGADADKCKLGDVLVASRIVSYASNTKVQPNGDEEHRDLTYEHLDNGWRDQLHTAFVHQSSKKPNVHYVHYGPILSAGYLLKNARRKAELITYARNHVHDVIGGDMESFSLAAAANTTNNRSLHWLWIKGVCDHATAEKADGWQVRAAANAALVLEELLNRNNLRAMLHNRA